MTIEAIASALPAISHDADAIAAVTGGDAGFIREKVGVNTRRILAPEQSGVDLAHEACLTLLDQTGLKAADLGLLVFVTQNPDRTLPQNSAMLAARLGLPSSCAAFDLALGCSGFVYGLAVTEAFLRTFGQGHALLVCCDPYSRVIDPSDIATNAVFGDAATATWVRADGSGLRLTATDFGTDGSGGDAIAIASGAAVGPAAGKPAADPYLRMNGRAVFNFVMDTIPGSIARCLDAAGRDTQDIDLFALHQGSRYMLEMLVRRAGLPPSRTPINLSETGNTVSSSIPLVLEADLARRGHWPKSALICGFGVGLSWATAVLTSEETNR